MRPSPGLRYACAGAAVAAMLLYAAWPAPAPERKVVAAHDNYFAFVKATPSAPPVGPMADTWRDGATTGTADAPASPTALAQMETEVHALREQGADEQTVYRLRARRVNAQMAAQLAEREQAEKAWQRRVQAYRAEREQLAVSAHPVAGDDAANQAAQARLRAERFAPDEQAQLEASLPPTQPTLRQD